MSQFGQELSPNDAPALPLWIDGHAYLLMAEQFHTVVNGKGDALRRVPLYGDDAVAIAASSTEKAVLTWGQMPENDRAQCFVALHELLGRFRGHLGKLLEEEAGMSHELAEIELAQSLAAIAGRSPALSSEARVAAVSSDALAPLAAPLTCVVDALAAGWGVVLKPSTKAPSALFALAEVFSRAGFPAGLINCVHGDEEAMRALCASPKVSLLAFVGADKIAQRIASMAGEHNKPCVVGVPDAALQDAWRKALGAGS